MCVFQPITYYTKRWNTHHVCFSTNNLLHPGRNKKKSRTPISLHVGTWENWAHHAKRVRVSHHEGHPRLPPRRKAWFCTTLTIHPHENTNTQAHSQRATQPHPRSQTRDTHPPTHVTPTHQATLTRQIKRHTHPPTHSLTHTATLQQVRQAQ